MVRATAVPVHNAYLTFLLILSHIFYISISIYIYIYIIYIYIYIYIDMSVVL